MKINLKLKNFRNNHLKKKNQILFIERRCLNYKKIENIFNLILSKKNSFIVVDAYENDEEKQAMYAWNLTAKTILHKDEWKNLFKEANYTGDYYWFLP